MSVEDVEPDSAFTPFRRVLLYYPQRVQIMALALLNLLFLLLAEFGIDLSAALVGGLNTVVYGLMVFFYGEKKTSSKQAVHDWLKASEG